MSSSRRLLVPAVFSLGLLASFGVLSARRFDAPPSVRIVPTDELTGPDAAVKIVYGVLGLGPVLLMIAAHLLSVRNERLAVRAGSDARHVAPTEPGRTVVTGTVRAERDVDDAPVLVEIEQRAKEFKDKNGSRWTRWSEQARTIRARPFRLELEDGATVRVDPGRDPWLIDELDRTQPREKGLRSRIAQLEPGESCTVSGVARRTEDPEAAPTGDGYRTVKPGRVWTIERPPGEPMRIAKDRLIQADHERRTAFHRGWFWRFAACALLSQLLCAPFHLRACAGNTTRGAVLGKRLYVTHTKNSSRAHYVVSIAVGDSSTSFESEVTPRVYDTLHPGVELAVIEAPITAFRQLGARPAISSVLAGIGVIGWIAMLGYYLGIQRGPRPWYARGKVTETVFGRL